MRKIIFEVMKALYLTLRAFVVVIFSCLFAFTLAISLIVLFVHRIAFLLFAASVMGTEFPVDHYDKASDKAIDLITGGDL